MESQEEQSATDNRNSFKNGLLRVASFIALPATILAGSTIGLLLAPEGHELAGSIIGTLAPIAVGAGILLAFAMRNRNNRH